MTDKIKVSMNTWIVVEKSTLTDQIKGFNLVLPNRKYPYKENFESFEVIRIHKALKLGFKGFILPKVTDELV